MNPFEQLEFNIKLFLINNAGLIYLNKFGIKLLQTLTTDPMLIKMHRILHRKYGPIIKTYIITKNTHYYILDPDLA